MNGNHSTVNFMADMERIELFWVAHDIEIGPPGLSMMSSMENQRKNPIPDNNIHGSKVASPGLLLRSNNVLNRLNCCMNHQDLINTFVFEQGIITEKYTIITKSSCLMSFLT